MRPDRDVDVPPCFDAALRIAERRKPIHGEILIAPLAVDDPRLGPCPAVQLLRLYTERGILPPWRHLSKM